MKKMQFSDAYKRVVWKHALARLSDTATKMTSCVGDVVCAVSMKCDGLSKTSKKATTKRWENVVFTRRRKVVYNVDCTPTRQWNENVFRSKDVRLRRCVATLFVVRWWAVLHWTNKVWRVWFAELSQLEITLCKTLCGRNTRCRCKATALDKASWNASNDMDNCKQISTTI